MKVTNSQIAKWIEDYLKQNDDNIHKRNWNKKYVYYWG